MNLLNLISQLMMGGNPMQMMMGMFSGNPMFQQAMNMVNGKNPEQIQQVAKNICSQKGIDYNTMQNMLESQFAQSGIKSPFK